MDFEIVQGIQGRGSGLDSLLRETNSGREALETGMKLEAELIPQYEWLIQNAYNDSVKEILNEILYQTRMHYTMFQHTLFMVGDKMR